MTNGPTGTKSMSKEISYNVKLFVRGRALLRNSPFKLEKLNPSTGEYDQIVQRNENLFGIKDNLRLIIEDNAANGNPVTGARAPSRSQFYVDNGLVKFLNASVRLLVIVEKFEGPSKTPAPLKENEVEVVFEAIDPPEDTSRIKGPRFLSADRSKSFMERFLNQMAGAAGADNDNSVRDFIMSPFNQRCRVSGDKVAASDILYQYPRPSKTLKPLAVDPSDKNLAKTRIRNRLGSKGTPAGVVNVFFRPPPIPGDNYRLKVSLKNIKGESVPLKDDSGGKCDSFQTSTITVWKKAKIHMVVVQQDASYNSIKWDQVNRAYADAFIEIEQPPPKRRPKVTIREWMAYLNKFVYGPRAPVFNWRRSAWIKYAKASNAAQHTQDFKNYCFPQDVVYNYVIKKGDALYKIARKHGMTWKQLYDYDGLTGKSNRTRLIEQKRAAGRTAAEIEDPNLIDPGNIILAPRLWLTPSDDVDPTSWDLVKILARRIIRRKLGGETWSKIKSPSKGRRLGLCVLLCKRPSPTSTMAGAHIGGKIFFMVEIGDVTNTFIHELGHALFLNHAVTEALDATQNPVGALAPHREASIVVRYEKGGSRGPYFEQHDSEDMVPCVMSYASDYYKISGTILLDLGHPDHFGREDHYTNWHFCGVCLLLLKFCDPEKVLVANNDSFRRIQYNAEAPKIARRIGESPSPIGTPIVNIDFPNALNLKPGDTVNVYCLYRQEARGTEHFKDNKGRDLYKDLSHLTEIHTVGGLARGSWNSTTPGVADVLPGAIGDYRYWFLEAISPGNTTIHFEIRYGPNAGDVIRSNAVPVTVAP